MFLKPLKSLAKAVISPVVDATGLYARRIHEASAAPGRWTIVMYHRVIDDEALDPFQLGMCVMRTRFEQQIRYLRGSFNIIGVREAMRRLDAGEPLPARALSITFDDGYLDNLTTALPIMEGLGVPFTVFVPTGGLAAGDMLWWDRTIAALACTRQPSLDLHEAGLSQAQDVMSLKGVGRYATVDRVLEQLWGMGLDAAMASVQRIEQLLAPFDARHVFAHRLAPPQVQQLRQRGVEIGAHSVHHPNLGLATEELARREMTESRNYLESLLQEPVTGFAYPGGKMRSETARLAREVGFEYALSTDIGVNSLPYDRYRLRRIGMPDSALPDFRRAFSGALLRAHADVAHRF